MEAVSLAASIAGLVTLADLVFRAAVKYHKSVKDAPKEVKALVDEVKDLSLLLHNLSLVEYGLAAQPDPAVQANARPPKPLHLQQCQNLLRRLQSGLPDLEAGSGLQKLQGRLKWPFSISDTKEMLQAIGRHKQTINIALTAQSISKLQIYIETKISLNENREKILKTFLPVNPRVEFEANKSLRHPMTALWLTEGTDFGDWFNTERSRLWCSGIPGAGKSVIAGAIVDECLQLTQNQPKAGLGYFFCTYKDPRTVLPCNVLSTLCYQLALQHEDAFQILEAYYKELHPSPHLPMPPKTSRLIEVLHDICRVFSRVYLIVDGLDECGDHTDETVRSMLRVSLATANKNINVALLSRDELMIREKLEDHFDWIEIEAHTHDIQLYVASQLAQLIEEKRLRLRDPSLKDEIVVKLVEGAKGMFRWVTCQLHHLCELPTDRARREALGKLPPTLFETYERILNNIESRSEAVRQLVERSLLLISINDPFKTLTSRALCEAISISETSDSLDPDEVVDEQEVLRWCGSLVKLSQTDCRGRQTFQYAHFTVQEFLDRGYDKHPLLGIYGISETKADLLFMRLAIRFLTLKNFEKFPTVEYMQSGERDKMLESRPFYTPASTYWTIGALLDGDQNTQDLLSRLFHIEKTPNFCLWATELIRNLWGIVPLEKAVEVLTSILRHDFTPLHMAAALGLADICHQLIRKGARIDLMSHYGTPLHFAVGGLHVFLGPNDDNELAKRASNSINGERYTFYYETVFYRISSQEQLKTVQLFVSSKAKTGRRLSTSIESFSLLTVAILTACSYEIIAQLIENRVVVEEEDLQMFDRMHECAMEEYGPNDFKREYNQGMAFLRILNALRFDDSTGKRSSPEGRLFKKTVQFASKMALDVPSDLALSSISEEISDQLCSESVLSAIEDNNITLLETLLSSRRCQNTDLSDLDPRRLGWSPIHIAVEAGSLDCLEFLLDWGLDPNSITADNQTPIQLSTTCRIEDIMQALLKHGASTTKPCGEYETLWHAVVDSRNTAILRHLLCHENSKNRALALRTASGQGDTPICRALTTHYQEAVFLLLQFCNTEHYWKCSKPIYRAAAEFGSSQVLDVLLDVGIQYDSHDEYDGNPLHWIHIDSDLRMIERLKVIFSCNQRRTRDLETPFQSLLDKATKLDYDCQPSLVMSLLPDDLFTSPHQSRALWYFLCTEIIPLVLFSSSSKTYFRRFCTDLLERGVAKLYEEDSSTSALIPLTRALKGKLSASVRDAFDGGEVSPSEEDWQWCSDTICRLLEGTNFKNELAREESLDHFLYMAILRNDHHMAGLLLEVGVNCHIKGGTVTPFELACLPSPSDTTATLSCLVDRAKPKLLTQRSTYTDLGPLHLIAGLIRDSNAYYHEGQSGHSRSLHKVYSACYAKDKYSKDVAKTLEKLEVLLDAGADPNLPSDSLSPMTYHILRHHFHTAEALLNRGADPWVQGSFTLDSVLAAILTRNVAFLDKITQQVALHNYPSQWNRTYTIALCNSDLYPQIHALHVAVIYGHVEALEFYHDRDLVTNLDVKDGNQQTPMHYAASNGNVSVIDYLVAHGCDINAPSSSGLTPLHLAVRERRTGAVDFLLNHGARQQPCHAGRSPMIYAYNTGYQPLIRLLQNHSNQPAEIRSAITDRGLQDMRDALSLAISRNDLEACRRIHQLGCPLDVEVKPKITPLVLAIELSCSASLVEWLLNSNVRSSALCWHERLGRLLTPLHLVLMNPAYNSILGAVVTKHLQEGDLSSMHHWNPFVIAIEYRNTPGLLLLLETLKTHCSAKDFSSLVKQTSDSYSQYGPIATCGRHNNPEALIYLVNFGGSIDCCGDLFLQAFSEAAKWDSYQVAEYLVSRCTRPVENPSFATNPLLSACFEDSFSVIQLFLKTCTISDTLDCFGNNAINLLADSTNSNPGTPSLAVLMSLIDHGIDPFINNDVGINACHHILAHDFSAYLRYILVRFPRCFSNQPFRWPPAWAWFPPKLGLRRLGNISRNLRLVRPFVNATEFRLLTDLPSCEGHTMLCQALLQGPSEVFRKFIELGVDIERPCRKHGTPLVVALNTGYLLAVKCLVHSGAKFSLSDLLISGMLRTLSNDSVRDWRKQIPSKMTAYFHLLCRRRPDVEMRWYAPRLRRFIRKNQKKHQYTYQLYRDDTVLRVTVICDPQEAEVEQALRDMGDAMVKHRLHRDWDCFGSVLNEDPTEVPAEELDMAKTKPWREPKPKPEPKLREGAKFAGFFSFFSCF
ncbi:Ff.00g133710.m01.CDS01 [Fusarium sp. VM40]|nr:Ff.00g133710.m01.CDS01 [Fusarium sp. VM40]